jgi:hypothetical protein
MNIANFELTGITQGLLDKLVHFVNVNNEDKAVRSRDGKAELLVSKEMASLTANYTNGVIVNSSQTTINGKTHLTADPSEVRFTGYWKLNDELLTCLPSTLYTPIPVLKFREPAFAEHVADLQKIKSAIPA